MTKPGSATLDAILAHAVPGLDLGLNVLEKIQGKLVAHPDKAAERLAAVLAQLRAMYSALDEALSSYNGILLWSDMSPQDLKDPYNVLTRLSASALTARFAESRAHCSLIENIYTRFLENWFQKWLNPKEQKALRVIFTEKMTQYDNTLVESLDAISGWLGEQAQALKAAIDAKDWEEAERIQTRTRPQAAKLQEVLSQTWTKLAKMWATFIQVSGTAG